MEQTEGQFGGMQILVKDSSIWKGSDYNCSKKGRVKMTFLEGSRLQDLVQFLNCNERESKWVDSLK